MKICVISSTVFPVHPPLGTLGYSGLEVLAWQQAEGLAKKGHAVLLCAPDGSRCDHAQVLHTGPPGGHGEEQAYARYSQVLHQFDCVIDHSWSKPAYLLKEAGNLPAPVLGVMHAPVNTMIGSPPPVEKPCIVCISDDQRSHYEALFAPHRARTAHNGVDLDFYKPLNVPRSGRFLFLARFSTIKGPDLAIDACRAAGAGLDLIGDTSITNEPEFLQRCTRLVGEANLEAHKRGRPLPEQRMVGPAKRGECVWWFSQAHCLLHPNQRFREPFGLAPVEAMACGTPVIAWDYGAMRETVGTDGGVLVRSMTELVDAVRSCGTVFGNGNILDQTARERCRENAARFSLPRMIDRYAELCQEAIETGGW